MPNTTTPSTVLIRGPRIIYLAVLTVIVIQLFAFQAPTWPEGAHQFLRSSGRLGLALFISSFGASTLNRLLHSNWTRYLLTNRRYLGISTAIVLWAHFATILSLIAFNAGWKEVYAPLWILVPGSSTFVLVGLMALTSNKSAQKRLGFKNWKRLHLAAGYSALAAFIFEYVLQLFIKPEGMDITVSPLLAYMLLGIGVAFLFLRLAGLSRSNAT